MIVGIIVCQKFCLISKQRCARCLTKVGQQLEKCFKWVIISYGNKRTSPESMPLAESKDCLGVL